MAEQEIEELFEPQTIAERDNMLDEQAILSAMGEDPNDIKWSINAYRIPKDGGKDVAIFREADPRAITHIVDRLMDYGTGQYRVLVYRNNRLYRKMIYPIEVLETKGEPEKENGLTALASIMTAAMERQERQTQMILSVLDKSNKLEPRGADPFEQMERMSAIFANMNAGRAPIEQNQSTSLIETLKLGIELGKDAGGGGDSKTGALDLLRTFMEKGGLESVMAPRPTPIPIQSNNIPPQQPQLSSQQTLAASQFQLLNVVINHLGEFAGKSVDVAEVTPWVFANVPETLLDGLLQTPNALDSLAVRFKVIEAHRGWFTALLAHIKKVLSEGEHEQNDAGRNPGGDTGNSGNA